MNINHFGNDIILHIYSNGYRNQRELAEGTGMSLGAVNQELKKLRECEYLDEHFQLTKTARDYVYEGKPKNAIILAAGFGTRMLPISHELPKCFAQVHGEPMIERIINQLHEVGIFDITIVVGFMKEAFDYLIDTYNVRLKINSEYALKNNMHSLYLLKEQIGNSYIIPSDIWCSNNPFRNNENHSWYMMKKSKKEISDLRINKKEEVVHTKKNGNTCIGIAYIHRRDADVLVENLTRYSKDKNYDDQFWEEAAFVNDKMFTYARIVNEEMAYEVDTYEALRKIDKASTSLVNSVIEIIAEALQCNPVEIANVEVSKEGMTNRSFSFVCQGKKYIMRIPGEGTSDLIDRTAEYNTYTAIKGLGLSDKVIYMNPSTGYKITEFIEGAHCCDCFDFAEVAKCMEVLRKFHSSEIEVDHVFDLFQKLEYYEKLREGHPSLYRDYLQTKEHIYELKSYIEQQEKVWGLCHIDAVPDNYLLTDSSIYLIDWEYGAMQDKHLDVAMFGIYSGYDREQMEKLIDLYFENNCPCEIRTKIYCYIAISGLVWSNWCEYKSVHGVEFGEYSIQQYRYAKDYYKIAIERIENE